MPITGIANNCEQSETVAFRLRFFLARADVICIARFLYAYPMGITMDVYCRHCGEPCDVYHLHHDMEPEYRKMFKEGKGCDCCQGKGERLDNLKTGAMDLLSELLGDDVDGIASMMDDFEYLGMLDD